MAGKIKASNGLSDRSSDIILILISVFMVLIVAYPLYYVLVASVSNPYDVYAGKTFLLPSEFSLKGYQAVFADSSIFLGYLNSLKSRAVILWRDEFSKRTFYEKWKSMSASSKGDRELLRKKSSL